MGNPLAVAVTNPIFCFLLYSVKFPSLRDSVSMLFQMRPSKKLLCYESESLRERRIESHCTVVIIRLIRRIHHDVAIADAKDVNFSSSICAFENLAVRDSGPRADCRITHRLHVT